MKYKKPRVRFAPSPTGQLHLGGARTALYNWLFAKNKDGIFILRIEDTDKIRSKQEYTDQICDSLKWLGLDWDEEIIYQSQRLNIYKSAIRELLDCGNAYPCFCSKNKIAEDRKKAESEGGAYLYPGTCRNLDQKIVLKRIESGEDHSVRIKIPKGKTPFNDIIYGNIEIDNKELDDFIIARTDGTPVYNLVVVVDDHDMRITHVIRGEDHIANTPKQIIIYDALKYTKPIFAHLPMILGPDKKRLSKRHGATGVQEYKEKGYLPEALTNYLALLGWNPGTEQELYFSNKNDMTSARLEKLIADFSLDRIQKKSAVFDEKKLEWINKQHIQKKYTAELYFDIKSLYNDWILRQKNNRYLFQVIDLMKERVNNINDFVTKTEYFFNDPTEYEEKAVRKRWKDNSVNDLIAKFEKLLDKIKLWDAEQIEIILRKLAESENISAGKIIHPTRLALSGIGSGPSLFAMMELLGKEICLRRLQKARYVLTRLDHKN